MWSDEQKAKIARQRAEDEAKWKRRKLLVEREGVEKMTDDELRGHLVTCDYRGCEAKEAVLDELLARVREIAFEAGVKAGEG